MISSKLIDSIVSKFFFICAFSSIIIVMMIFVYILSMGFPQMQQWLLNGFGLDWKVNNGILSPAFYSLYTGAGSTVIAAAVGIPVAIYLAEYADIKIRNIVKPSLEVLTSIPSILVGLIGVVLIVTTIKDFFNLTISGVGVLAAWIVLFVLSLPLVASVAEDAIRAVPHELKEASLALGATKWQTTLRVSLPVAKSGIIAALVLAMGNAIGETMAVWMVVGGGVVPSAAISPTNFFGPIDTIPTLIALYYKQGESDTSQIYSLAGAAILLFIIVGGLNIAIRRMLKEQTNLNRSTK
ncbi:MAG: phosphate ABC transporter permease subunit PstC [Candidatus Bathyarchaeota archaeon]|nr:phosphate ABC transporter permease subunit PstC [Candidatus Bathyarchaeota archaeon]